MPEIQPLGKSLGNPQDSEKRWGDIAVYLRPATATTGRAETPVPQIFLFTVFGRTALKASFSHVTEQFSAPISSKIRAYWFVFSNSFE